MKIFLRFFRSTSAIMLLAVGLRGVALFIGADSLQDDPDAYARLAVNFAESGVLGVDDPRDDRVEPTAFRPPLYPLLLSLFVSGGECSRLGVALLHLLLGTFSVWLVLSIGRHLQLRWAPLAALACAVDPLLLRQSQLVMTETLATCLALAVWRLWLALPPGGQVSPPLPRRRPAAAVRPNRALPDSDGDIASNGDTASDADTADSDGEAPMSTTPAGGGAAGDTHQRPRAGETRRGRWNVVTVSLAIGLMLGLSILCRPTAAPWALLCVMALALWRLPWQSLPWQSAPSRCCRLAAVAAVLAGVVANVGPWTLRNWRELGRPIWATTHGGYTLLLANNPSLYQHFAEHGPARNWQAKSFLAAWTARGRHSPEALLDESYWLQERDPVIETTGWSELENDRVAYSAARETIKRDPGMFLVSSLYRIGWLWAWWPNIERLPVMLAIGIWYGIWSLAAIFALVRRPPRLWLWGWLPIFLLAFSLTAVHSVYWSNMRMRCPVVPGVYLLAIAGCGQRVAPPRT